MFRFCAWRHLDKLLGPRWALRCRWFFQLLHKSRNSRHCDAIVNIYHILPRYSWQSVTTRLKVWRCDVLCCQCVCDIKPATTKPALEQYFCFVLTRAQYFTPDMESRPFCKKSLLGFPKDPTGSQNFAWCPIMNGYCAPFSVRGHIHGRHQKPASSI